jgi:hypothetical protein
MKPLAGFELSTGTNKSEPVDILGFLGGLSNHTLSRSGKSFCLSTQVESFRCDVESCAGADDTMKIKSKQNIPPRKSCPT